MSITGVHMPYGCSTIMLYSPNNGGKLRIGGFFVYIKCMLVHPPFSGFITFIHYPDKLSGDSKFSSDKFENRSNILMKV